VRRAPVLGLLEENFPWSRAVWATLIDKLANAGARIIIVDLIFSAPGRDDAALRQVLDKYRDRVVIGCNFSDLETERGVFLKLNSAQSFGVVEQRRRVRRAGRACRLREYLAGLGWRAAPRLLSTNRRASRRLAGRVCGSGIVIGSRLAKARLGATAASQFRTATVSLYRAARQWL